MTEYVLGFLINLNNQVALVRKKHGPGGQAGKLNGFGGKIEPNEFPLDAMNREFLEESGWPGSGHWYTMRPMEFDDAKVHCFWQVHTTFYEFNGVEDVEVFSLDDIAGACVKNVRRWLRDVEVAYDMAEQLKLSHPWEPPKFGMGQRVFKRGGVSECLITGREWRILKFKTVHQWAYHGDNSHLGFKIGDQNYVLFANHTEDKLEPI